MRQQKSFVLKLWNDSCDEKMWRASLEDIHTKEKCYFSSLKALSIGLVKLIELKEK